VGKIAEKAVSQECIFDNMALYFQCQINKNPLLRLFFGDFAHWDTALSELPRGWSQRRHYKYEDKKHVGKQSGRRF